MTDESATSTDLTHILVVEDNAGDAMLLRQALEDESDAVAVHHVENGVQAYEFLGKRGRFGEESTPDLIVLDLNLPVISGHDILRTLRLDPEFARTPVVILSSSALDVDLAAAKRGGATAYQVKPSLWHEYAPVAARFLALAQAGRKRR